MRLITLFITTLTIIPSFISAAAVPTVAPRNETLAKRGGEVNYLANCRRYNDEDVVDYATSYIAWYANVDNSLSGHDIPNSLSNEYRDWSHGDGTSLHWEGQQQNIHFKDSGVTVQTHIDADAGSRGFTAWAGWAQRTSDWKYFNCYKDNSRPLFIWTPPVPDGTQNAISCWSIYWCV